MSRKKRTQDDSLEMLLDTVCNAFGGLVLIAILVAILAKNTNISKSEDILAQAEFELQLGKNNRKKLTTENLKETYTNLHNTALSIDSSITNNWTVLTNLIKQINAKTNLINSISDSVGNSSLIKNELEELIEKIGEIENEIAASKSLINAIKININSNKNQRTEKVRPPVAEVAQLQSAVVVISNGKFWALNNFDRNQEKVLNEAACIVHRNSNGTINKLSLKPRSGLPIPNSFQGIKNSQIGNYLKLFPKSKFFCKVFIHKSSFDKGSLILKFLSNENIRHNWIPDSRNEIYFEVGNNGTERVQ